MNAKNASAVLVFFFVFWFGLLALSGSLSSGFHLTDDHQIIVYSETLKEAGALKTALGWISSDMSSTGRFLPLYYVHRLLEIKLFGTDFFVWGLYDGLLAWAASSLMAFFMLSLSFTLFEAVVFPLLLFLGFQTGIWWRFGTAETIGMPLVGVMLVAAAVGAKRKSIVLDIVFVLAGVLLMLAKETFILFIPALVFMKVWLGAKEAGRGWAWAIRKEALPAAVLLAVAGAEILFIRFFVGTTGIGYAGYGGFEAGPFVSALVNYLYASHAWLVPVSLALALSALRRRSGASGDIAAVLVFMLLALVPQALLHARSGVSERYLLPGVFGVVFASVYFLRLTREALSRQDKRQGWGAFAAWAAALLFVVLGAHMIGTRKLGITFAVESLSLLSEVEPVPALSFATAWLHAFTQKWFLWAAVGLLAAFAAAGRAGVLPGVLNQRVFIAALLSWAVLFNLSIGFDSAFHHAFQGRATNEWLASIEDNTGPDDAILVVADPAVNNEWALSVKRYLGVKSGRTALYAYPVYTRPAYTPFERTLIESFGSIYGRGISDLPGPSSIKAVAILPNAEEAFLRSSASWFAPEAHSKYVNMYGFTSYYRAR